MVSVDVPEGGNAGFPGTFERGDPSLSGLWIAASSFRDAYAENLESARISSKTGNSFKSAMLRMSAFKTEGNAR